jgi:hypothetical protein
VRKGFNKSSHGRLAALSLCRTPGGAEAVFWLGPWSCCFWCLIYMTPSAVPWREGGAAVHQWREEHGGFPTVSSIGAACVGVARVNRLSRTSNKSLLHSLRAAQ